MSAPTAIKPMRNRLTIMAGIAVAELLAVIITYQVIASIECRQTEIEAACRALRSMTARGLAVITVLALYFWLRPRAYQALREATQSAPGPHIWLTLHGLGLALIFLPLPLFGATEISHRFLPTLLMMTAGGTLAALGALLWITPARQWWRWLQSQSYFLPVALLGAVIVPDLADLMRPLWNIADLSSLTFFLVFLVLSAMGVDVGVDPASYVIGYDDFFVQIASQCSGVEGIALITIFMGLYAMLMKADLRMRRFWLALFPLAVLCSWLFNILRIAILIVIGAEVSAEHALNGFHSYAGWLMFTALALGVVAVAHQWAWLHRTPRDRNDLPRLAEEGLAALIVPFIVMMITGVVASAFWPTPSDAYPFRAVAMLCVLLYFRPALVRLVQRPEALAVLAGIAVGALWLITAPVTQAQAAAPSTAWIAFRLLGTIALVPVIEELFFRGYIQRRLMRGGLIWVVLALLLPNLLFGLLHERYLAGMLAGAVFGLLALRKHGLTNAIAAHGAANAVIAVYVLFTANWALI
ncbi:exosortase E/protease, VPEID-CTERM system [Shimia sp. Alg240-R146]|uniref:exosortase E/protease, VPEID-CTERM system n=1 Tax=Shimia sp. Alg240-R146 TaxID=2993449 RepID=UPI0022E4028D|nr:exosortase E/protease, VPEID-CTERM system [Shimia sp. Alg240-R146]